MSKAQEVIDLIEKGPQFRTKVKEVVSNQGSRHIRNTVEQAGLKLKNMLNPKHGSPNPKKTEDEIILKEVGNILKRCAERLKEVKDSRRKKK